MDNKKRNKKIRPSAPSGTRAPLRHLVVASVLLLAGCESELVYNPGQQHPLLVMNALLEAGEGKDNYVYLHQSDGYQLGAVPDALDHAAGGTWSEVGGTNGNYGLEEGDYIGLPTAETSWAFRTFTVEDYQAELEKLRSGEITVDNSSDPAVQPTTSEFTTVNYQE